MKVKSDRVNQHYTKDGVPLWCQDAALRKGYQGGWDLVLFDKSHKHVYRSELPSFFTDIACQFVDSDGNIKPDYHYDLCYTFGQLFEKE